MAFDHWIHIVEDAYGSPSNAVRCEGATFVRRVRPGYRDA